MKLMLIRMAPLISLSSWIWWLERWRWTQTYNYHGPPYSLGYPSLVIFIFCPERDDIRVLLYYYLLLQVISFACSKHSTQLTSLLPYPLFFLAKNAGTFEWPLPNIWILLKLPYGHATLIFTCGSVISCPVLFFNSYSWKSVPLWRDMFIPFSLLRTLIQRRNWKKHSRSLTKIRMALFLLQR